MEKQQNKIPEVRFPEFIDDWEHKQLNELLSVSKTKNGDLKYGKEEVLSVSGDFGIVNQIEHLGRSYAGASVHNYGVVELNQIVYTKSPLKANPYGIIKVNKHKAGIVSTLYAVYDVNEETDGQFIEYYFSLNANLNRYLRPLVRKGAKNDMKISNEYVLNDRIYAPQLKEQKKIANFFSIVDKKITQLQEKKTALELYKKGMMQQIFSQQLRFKDDNGKDFPEWNFKKLGAVTYKVGKKNKDNINYPVYSINNNKGFVPQAEQFEDLNSTERGYDISMYKIVNEKTFAYNPARINVGSLGYSYDLNKVIVSSLYVCFKANEELDNLYMLRYFDTYKFNTDILRFEEGGVRKYLFYDNFSKLTIPIPCNNEQNKIANFLSKIDEKINTVTEKIEQTKAYKKGLLQKMFCN